MKYLYHGSCNDVLKENFHINTIFADPPDNLGLEYVGYDDKMDPKEYYEWIKWVLDQSIARCGTFWLSYYYRHDLAISRMIAPNVRWRKIMWRMTFGQYNEHDHASGYRILLRLGVPGNLNAIREESGRMRLGDARAAGPRVPDDVWEYPRIVGNAGERRVWHPTQHPVALYQRIGKLANYQMLDLFAGTGTVFRILPSVPIVGKNPRFFGCETSEFYAKKILQDNPDVKQLDQITFVEALKWK